MSVATVDDPLLRPCGYHTFAPDLSCVDCRQDWPCPPYRAILRRVYGDDVAGMVAFMTSFLPAAKHLPQEQAQRRLVGWCTLPAPELAAPPGVAGRPLPHPRRIPQAPCGRPATPHPHHNTSPRTSRALSGAAS